LLEEIAALDRAYSRGHHGRWSASRRAELVDACLRELFADAGAGPGVALVALGGYGRSRLAPASDVDLLILHGGERSEKVLEQLTERLLYPLWDAGLTVGHAVRTPDGCLAAAERLDALTAMLDGRWLAGDREVWAETHEALVRLAREDPEGFSARLREVAAERAARYGSVSDLLEPELKEGAGGLRDVDAFGWLAVGTGAGPVGGLVEVGILRRSEREALDRAEELLIRVRSAVHLETGRPGDRLVLELQPAVAADLGFVDEPGLLAVDGLMRSVFEHARAVEHARDAVFDRVLRGEAEAGSIEPTPAGIISAFARAAESGASVPSETLDRIAEVDLDGPVTWDADVRTAFLRILRSGGDGVRALETLDGIGLLERYLPAWSGVRCRPQRDPYHRSSVDVHLLRTVEATVRVLAGGAEREDPVLAGARELAVSHTDALLVAALLHDIGKTGEGAHVRVGSRIAEDEVRRIGLEPEDADLVRFLVAEHLLLPDTSTRRDLEDDDLIADVAARVGDPARLAALYVLTVADAEATGPLAASPWRAALVRELVVRVQRRLERGGAAGAAERIADRAEALRGLSEDPDELERFLTRVPRSYLLTVPTELAAEHVRLARAPIGASEVRTLERRGGGPGTYSVSVLAADRPGLLSMIAGALTLAGLSILTAHAFTTNDEIALDVFEVEGVFETEIGEDRWREFRSTLRRAIDGRISLAHGVDEKRRRYPPPRGDVPVEIRFDNEASDVFTVIEIGAPDRIGLLFDVTRTFAELELDVHLAKVATYGARVVDAFYVRDAIGLRIEAPERAAEIERALRARISG
jgi:[protein-PII] uridylyltransferase